LNVLFAQDLETRSEQDSQKHQDRSQDEHYAMMSPDERRFAGSARFQASLASNEF
jgi:hypothetical protein